MESETIVNKQGYLFGSLFLLSNKLQVIMDREFDKHDMTAKQWFLTAVVEEFFEAPPTISELAKAMGTTHQNVKQIALKLQKKEFLQLIRDDEDRRVTRLKLSDKSNAFWHNRRNETTEFLTKFFQDLDEDEINTMVRCFAKLHSRLQKLESAQE